MIVFEAAGRLRSFSRAATELGITQAAVSYAIKQLEQSLEQPLFVRRHRHVELTEPGLRFHQDVALGLSHISRSADALRQHKADRHVTLSVSTAFVSHWLLPRLADFHRALPAIDLRLQTTDRDLDLAAEGLALGVRRGDGVWENCQALLLAREEIFAVASPHYLAKAKLPAGLVNLPRHRLIHLEEPIRPRPTWNEWFRAQGINYRDENLGLRLNDYALVLQAAVDGEGVALGWRHLVEGLLARGALKKVVPQSLKTGLGFYVAWPTGRPLSAEAAEVRDWLVAAARKPASALRKAAAPK